MKKEKDQSLFDFIKERFIPKEKRAAVRRLKRIQNSKEKSMDEKLKEIRIKNKIKEEQIGQFRPFLEIVHDLIPREVFEDLPKEKLDIISEQVSFSNDKYNQIKMTLSKEEYSISGELFPGGVDFSLKNKNNEEIFGWNDQSFHHKSLDFISDFDFNKKDTVKIKEAIEILSPKIKESIQFYIDKKKELGLDKYDQESRAERNVRVKKERRIKP